MRALEILLERRWILKSLEKELYYQIKDELGTVKKFLMEKLGYQVIVNPYLVKVEKMPATPENWMGIQEFTRKIEYVFFCMILMFLEEKEAEEQFVLSELTEYIQGQYREEQIDWTVYQYRRHLIKVIKYCVNCGILNLNDGSEENFARDDTSEVLYENTGVSRYFMKNFTQDIMGYTTPEDQAEKESLSDSDTVKLKQREVEIKSQLEGLKKNITGKQRQEEEKKEKYQETEQKIQLQFQKNEMLWEEIENSLEYMEEEMAGVPFDEFAFMKKELTEQGIPFKDDVEQGVMIETPAAVMISDLLAKEVDFFSIGTNDLTQYTLAIDRQNAKLDNIYDSHHEAVLRMIQMVIDNAHKEGIWAGICGELGADTTLTEHFIQMGIDELSVSPTFVLPVRKIVRELD